MNGEIAQLVALVCHGNAFLRGNKIPDFFPSNSTCTYCEEITFIEFKKVHYIDIKERQIASNPNKWFSLLRDQNVYGLRLSQTPRNDPRISDRMSAGFVGGGGVWAIEAIIQNGSSQFWRSKWEVWNQKAPDRRIWRVTYGLVAETKTLNPATKSLSELKANLKRILEEIYDFSQKHECGGFTKCFANALESLQLTAPNHGYHKDFSVDGVLSPEAIALLDSCQTAWVFGGMGSWNDMGFDGADDREYSRVSENLFRLLSEIIPAAANNSFRSN